VAHLPLSPPAPPAPDAGSQEGPPRGAFLRSSLMHYYCGHCCAFAAALTVASRSVKIGEGADMRGTITAESVRICGTVQGEIKAATVALEKTAKVTGNIMHQSLSIEAGAHFEGQCRRTDGASAGEGKRSAVKS